MRRRDLLLASAATLVMPAGVRPQTKIPVIGLLWIDGRKPSPYVAVLMDALRDRGWIAGRDFRVEDRVTLEGYGANSDAVAELIRAKVDLIVSFGTTGSTAAAKATKDIPIVMIVGSDPVAAKLVPSLSRPGGNVTGVATMASALNRKRVEFLKAMMPALSRIGVVLAPNVGNPISRRETEEAARALKLDVEFAIAQSADDVDHAVAELVKAKVGALYVGPASVFQARAAHIVDVIAKYGLPAIYGQERYVDAGGLLVYTASTSKAFIRAAGYVDRILRGARAGDLPIDQASDAELVVNLRTARALGIKVPQTLLVRADRVID